MNHVEAVRVLREIAEDLSGDLSLTVPNSNCSCHISAPCNDCVDYGGIRELLKTTQTILAATENIEQDEPIAIAAPLNSRIGITTILDRPVPVGTKLYESPQPAKPDAMKAVALFLEYENLMDSDDHVSGMLKYAELHDLCKSIVAPSTETQR